VGGSSLSVKLATTYAILVAATLLVVAGLAIHLTRRHLDAALDSQIVTTVESFQRGPARSIEEPDDLRTAARGWLATQAFPQGQVVAVRLAGDEVLESAGGLELRPLPNADELLVSAESRWWQLSGAEGSVRAISVPLRLGDRQIGTLAVGASREPLTETLSTLLTGIGWASAVGLAFATVLGLAAVRRTLRPLARMSAEIETIEQTRSLSRRLAHEGPQDEVGRLADAFNRMLGRLDESFNTQKRFLADASHELRTPLTVVRGQLELLSEEFAGATSRRSLGVAVDELDRMGRIVDDLLLLARLDEGLQLSREVVEVELIMREALLRAAPSPRAIEVDAPVGLCVVADPDRLMQVLTNLVVNAAQYAGLDARITLSARPVGDRVAIEVGDDGPGIAAHDLPHVFERLYRSSKSDAGSGAGMGLAIVASLVEAMDGQVSVHSTRGEGATFSVLLPLAHFSEEETPTDELPEVEAVHPT
jgi:signal transduction histidine kinase